MASKKNNGKAPSKVTASIAGASVNRLFIMDDETYNDGRMKDRFFNPLVNNEVKGHGLEPRDYAKYPREMFDPPAQIKVYAKDELSAVLKQQLADKSRNSDIRLTGNNGQPIPSLDQDGVGYCWAHSTTHAVIMLRALMNQPYVPLSAFAVAATIKKGRDEGGWGGLSAKFIREKGVPAQAVWPQGDRDYRKYDKPEVWTSAALHRITEDWCDLSRDVYDQNLAFMQYLTVLAGNTSGIGDFNWWGHSVCLLDAVEVEPGSFGIYIWNSWSDSWGEQGMGILRGSKAIPDGGLAVRSTLPSAA